MSSSTSHGGLTTLDAIVIGATLLLSAAVGIYNGCGATKKKDARAETEVDHHHHHERDHRAVQEYFLAGRSMSMLPVAVSFFATMCSTLSLIGPAMEVYGFGLTYSWFILANLIAGPIVAELFIPLFYNMGSINIYKFLELRYNKRMKQIVTILVVIRSVMVGSVVTYGTSAAFNQVTNISLWTFIGTITGVCMVYTTLGGMRGVMWVDVIQGFLMLGCMVIIVMIAIYDAGGVTNIWNANYDTGRLHIFVFELNLTTRHTFWNNCIGMLISQICFTVTSQANMQRFLTAPTLTVAKRSAYVGVAMNSFLILLSTSVGCIMYGVYYRCDPFTAKSVQNMNQLVPKFVVDVLGSYPILPGLFFAGVLSACLSTMSSHCNSLAAIIMETFIQSSFPKCTAKWEKTVCQILAIFVGLSMLLSVRIAENFHNVMQAAVSCTASVDGALLGVLLIGIFAPQSKIKIVATAFLGAVLTLLWIVVGGQIVQQPPKLKPLFTDGCLNDTTTIVNLVGVNYANISQFIHSNIVENRTMAASETLINSSWEKYFPLHGVTFQWLALIGVIVSITLFFILSAAFGTKDRSELTFDPLEFIPKSVQRFQRRLPKTLRKVLLCDVYDEPEKGQNLEMNNQDTSLEHIIR